MPTAKADGIWLNEHLLRLSKNIKKKARTPSTEEEDGIEEMVRHSQEQHQE